MYYYLIINEGLSNGLIESQVISPIIYNNLEKEVGVISLERPGRKSKLFKNIRKKIKRNMWVIVLIEKLLKIIPGLDGIQVKDGIESKNIVTQIKIIDINSKIHPVVGVELIGINFLVLENPLPYNREGIQ